MNRIDTSFAASGQPFLAPTSLDMLQDAYKNGFSDTIKSLIGSSYSATVPYILWGCESTGPSFVSTGAVFFDGELYFVPQWNPGVGPIFPNVLIAAVQTTYSAVDPVTFEDGSTHNIHNIRICNLGYGLSGAGDIGDFTDFVRVNTTSVDYSSIGANIGTRTIEMDRNKFIEFNGVGGAATVTLDATKAISGRVVEFRTATGTAGHTIDFAGVLGTTPVAVVNPFPYTLTANKPIFVRMKAIEVGAATFFVYVEIYELA
jgi:hypothetical protein